MELVCTQTQTHTHTCEVLPLVYLSIPVSGTLPAGFDRRSRVLEVQLPTVMTLYSVAGL